MKKSRRKKYQQQTLSFNSKNERINLEEIVKNHGGLYQPDFGYDTDNKEIRMFSPIQVKRSGISSVLLDMISKSPKREKIQNTIKFLNAKKKV